MAELLNKIGNGQVEPNRIQARKKGGVLADVPANAEVVTGFGGKVENGVFLAWNAGTGFEGNLKKGELVIPTADSTIFGLVYSEVKLYDEYHTLKDFALYSVAPSMRHATQAPLYDVKGTAHGTVIPRVLFMTPGDVFTTNQIETADGELPAEGDALKLNANGILSTAGTLDILEAVVAQVTTMPDGQPAVKVVITKVAY